MPDTSLLLMWTVLPRGIDTTQTPPLARLSVLVSPRVTLTGSGAPGSLADVPDLLDWPARVAGLQFMIEADPGTGASPVSIAATVVPGTLDSALWQALFPGAVPVQDRVFDQDGLHNLAPNSYGNATVVSGLKTGYTGVLTSSPVTLPAQQVVAQHFPALAATAGPRARLLTRAEVTALDEPALHAQRRAVAADLVAHARAGTLPDAVRHARDLAVQLNRTTGRPPGPLFPSDGTLAGELGRLFAFHTVPAPGDTTAPPPASTPFEAELHSVITLLHDHPALLSRLGLLVDLAVPAGNLPQAGLRTGPAARLSVTVTSAPGNLQASTTHYSPWTAIVLDGEEIFTPRASDSANPEMLAGLVNLALPGQYSLSQVDTDGATLKALSMSMQPPTADGSGLPAIRTTGPSLFRAGQEDVLKNRMAQAEANQEAAFGPAPAPVTLFAEDLTRGYRVDVRDHADGVWRSLHQRDATYSVPGLPDVVIREEGAVQPAGTLDSPDPQQATTLSVHESLARWEGWSLSVSPPGQAVGDDGPESLPSTPQPGGVPLTSSFTVVPGSLPRLRFGHAYDVRARVVDLGGGSLDGPGADAALETLHKLDPTGATLPVQPAASDPAFTFQRLEPVPSPVLVARERPTEGESAGRLVIRSSRTETAAQVAARLNPLVAAAAPDTGVRYLGVCERHLAPPKASQQTAERAGLLDGLTPAAAYLVSCKDKGALTDNTVWNISTGQDQPLADVPDPFTGGTRPAVELVASGASAFPVHHEDTLSLPYLPDWLAAGAVLCNLPGVPAGQQADVVTGALVITSSDLALQSPECPILSVTTIPFAGPWPLLVPLRLQLAEGSGPPSWDATQRVLTVQLPAGQTATVRLSSALPPGALDVMALWQWYVETQASPNAILIDYAQHGLTWPLTPFRGITLVHATQQPVLDPVITVLTAPRNPGDTGITLFGQVTLDANSTGQVELLASWTDPAEPGQPAVQSTAHALRTSLPPAASLGEITPGSGGAPDVLKIFGPAAYQEFGDTKYRRVTYQAVASTRFAEYFPAQVDVGPTTAAGPTLTIDVLSSAVPPAPRIREAVPMWRWDRPADPAQPRRRYNAGVRLLLEPPWFASGDGEELVVVLMYPTGQAPDDDLRSRVTHWGADPTFNAPSLPGPPAASSFPAAGPAVMSSLNDYQNQIVTLLPHPVTYDSDRGVYVCDIPVNPGSAYAPFIRLAVARYQPNSLSTLGLSAVVQAPFVQVLPERQVTLTPPAASAPATWAITVDGTSYVSTGSDNVPPVPDPGATKITGIKPVPPRVSVTVQERLPGTSDEAGWVPTSNCIISGSSPPQASPGTPLWTGQVTLPVTRTPGQFRILITEYELLDSDDNTPYSWTWTDRLDPPGTTKVIPVAGFYRPGSQRLVFAEEIII